MTRLRIVGASIPKVDSAAKARGEARYVGDVPWHGTLYGHVVRAQRAHALILGIHAEAALQCPGVRAVVTAADLDGLFPFFGHYQPDHPILAQRKVRYWGNPWQSWSPIRRSTRRTQAASSTSTTGISRR